MKKHRRLMRNRDVHFVPYLGWCPEHEKKAFSKNGAKRAIRTMHDSRMRKYRCYHNLIQEWWHIGHLPEAVRRGDVSAADHYQENGEGHEGH